MENAFSTQCFGIGWFYSGEFCMSKFYIYRLSTFCLVAAVLLLSAPFAMATNYSWADPSTTGDWSATASWNLGVVPLGTDNAYVANGGTANITAAGATCLNLYVGQTGFSNGYVNMTGGTFNVTTTSFTPALIGGTNNGQFDLSGGTATFGFGFTLGGSASAYSAVTGTFNLSNNAVLNATGAENIGNYGIGNFTQYSGTNNATGKNIILGYYGTGVGTYDIRDGSVTANTIYAGFNSSGNGTVKQSGGLITLASTTGLKLAANSATASGTYYLTGGTLNLKALSKGTGTAAFNFGLGTLQAAAAFTSSLDMNLSGLGSVNSTVTRATVDTNSNAVTLSGILSGVGGLNKSGGNTLTLSNADTYAGATEVQVGTLSVTGSLSSAGTVVVDPNAILAGTGSVGSVTVNGGGHIAPGVSGVGTLTDTGLSLISGAILDYDLASTAASDLIAMSGSTLALNGQQFSDFNFNPLTGFGPGVYTLISAGSVTGGLGSVVTGQVSGLDATVEVSGTNLVLNVVPEPGTLVLLATACLALLGYARRRRQ
jgi:fibronectin-binding autotransporter adhesin